MSKSKRQLAAFLGVLLVLSPSLQAAAFEVPLVSSWEEEGEEGWVTEFPMEESAEEAEPWDAFSEEAFDAFLPEAEWEESLSFSGSEEWQELEGGEFVSEDLAESEFSAEELVFAEDSPYTFELGVLTLTGKVDASTIDWEKLGGKDEVEEIEAESGASLGENCAGLFADLPWLTKVNLSGINGSAVRSLAGLFEGCSNLEEADLSSVYCPRLTTLKGMFAGCDSLTACSLEDFEAERVSDYSSLFQGCSSLAELDLSSWSCSYAEDLSFAFDGCKKLKDLQLGDFIGAEITSVKGMLRGCASLAQLDASQLDISYVQDMAEFCKGCSSLESLDLSSFGMDEVTNMASAFEGCSALTSVLFPAEASAGEKVTDASRLFADCRSLEKLTLPGFSSNLYKDQEMFLGADALIEITLVGSRGIWSRACLHNEAGGWVLSTNPQVLINPEYEYADLDDGSTGKRTYLFKASAALPYEFVDEGRTLMLGAYEYNKDTIDFSGYRDRVEYIKVKEGEKVSLVGDCSHMFENLTFLREADLAAMDFTGATDLSCLFKDCVNLTEAHFDTEITLRNLTDLTSAFDGCRNLRELTLPRMGGDSLKSIRRMCAECEYLETVETAYFDTPGVTDMTEAFFHDSSLASLDLQSWMAGQVTECEGMFELANLTYLYLPEFDSSVLAKTEDMFNACGTSSLSLPGGFAVTEDMRLPGTWVKKDHHRGYVRTIPAQSGRTLFIKAKEYPSEKYFDEEGVLSPWYGTMILGKKGVRQENLRSGSFIINQEWDLTTPIMVSGGEELALLLTNGSRLSLTGLSTSLSVSMDRRSLFTVYSDTAGGTGKLELRRINGNTDTMVEVNGGIVSVADYVGSDFTLHGGNVSAFGISAGRRLILDWKMPGTTLALTNPSSLNNAQVELRDCFVSLQEPYERITLENIQEYIQQGIVSGCEVTFDTAGGTARSGQVVPVDGTHSVTKPEDPVRKGFVFKEWEVEGEAYDFSSPVTSPSLTITAKWEKLPPVPYVDEYGESKLTDDYQVLEQGTRVLGSGWYYLKESVLVNTLEIQGTVTLLLGDGCTLTVKDGVTLEKPSSLTIYGQEKQSGVLHVEKETTVWSTASVALGGNPAGSLMVNGANLRVINNDSFIGLWKKERIGLLADTCVHAGTVEVLQGGLGSSRTEATLLVDWTSPRMSLYADAWFVNVTFGKNCVMDTRPLDLHRGNWKIHQASSGKLLPACEVVFYDGEEQISRQILAVDGVKTLKEPEKPVKDGYTFAGWEHRGESYDFSAPVVTDWLDLHQVWEKEGPAFTSFALALGGELGLFFYVNLPGDLSLYQDSYMEFTLGGKTQKAAFSEAEHLYEQTYGFPVKLNVLQMADEITAAFHWGEEVIEIPYSVFEYLAYFREHSSLFDEPTVTLAESVADYGHYCQIFLAKYHNWTVGVDHAEMPGIHEYSQEEISRVREASALYADVRSGESEDMKIQYSLALSSKPTLSVYLTCREAPQEVRATVDGQYVPVERTKNINNQVESCYVRIENIPADQSDVFHEVCFTADGAETKIRLCPLSYVQRELDPETTHGQEGIDALTSYFRYYEALKSYLKK